MKKIIALCGRKESGKTELSKICEKHGYKRIYFAQPLKELCSTVFGKPIIELDTLKSTRLDIILDDVDITLLSDLSGLPIDYCLEKVYDHVFTDARDIFQFIGTDLIRAYDKDWHVKKTKELIDRCTSDLIVIDDVRFPNELDFLKSLGADIWFVARPKIDNVSNHISETSIRWQDVGHVIENDKPLDVLLSDWNTFVEYHDKMVEYRDNVYSEVDKYIKYNGDTVKIDYEPIRSDLIKLFYPLSKLSYNDKLVNNENVDNVIDWSTEDKSQILVTYKDNISEVIDNVLMIEDAKFYL